MNRTETPYSSKEVTARLDIGESTLRKWCLALEEQNYNFLRTAQNKRMFSEKDLFVLGQFKILVQEKNLSMQNAAEIVASRYSEDLFPNQTEIERRDSDGTLGEIKKEIQELKDLNRELLQRLSEQQKYIEKRLEERDRLLMQAIRESQETKKLIAAAREENKKSFWSRLFGK